MSHVKAWYGYERCTHGAECGGKKCIHVHPILGHDGLCPYYENSNRTVEQDDGFGHVVQFKVIDDKCICSEWADCFIERDYKRVSASPHYATYDGLFGFYDLEVGRTVYECSYLEIDGEVICDCREGMEASE